MGHSKLLSMNNPLPASDCRVSAVEPVADAWFWIIVAILLVPVEDESESI